MPKKKKIVQDKNETPRETGGSFKVKTGKADRTRRVAANRKPRGTTARKVATVTSVALANERAETADPSDEAIRLRAYFISERRRRLGLPGDAESDWVEAKRQLFSEVHRR